MLQKLLLIALAGGLGTLARYGLAGLVQRLTSSGFPWGTVVVNALGCLVFGILWAAATESFAISAQTRTVLLVGFMGAFTTFSTYVAETSGLLGEGQWAAALGNLLLQNVLGIALFFAGLALGRWATA